MSEDLVDHLVNWLVELNLPEPEISYTVTLDRQEFVLSVAYPEQRLGLLPHEGKGGVTCVEGWTIWRYENLEEARSALQQVGEKLGAEPQTARLDFGRVEDLFGRGLLDMARAELERLQESINPEHPDWDEYEKRGSRIRRAQRKARRAKGRRGQKIRAPSISAAQLLKADGARLQLKDLPAHNLLGLFTPTEQVEMGAIDAVWVAQVRPEGIEVWPATAKGHPTYESDPEWELLDTEGDLLATMLMKLADLTTFVWDSGQVLPLLQSWHYRVTGNPLPATLATVDLRALCLIAFPKAQRVDRPESLCQELNLEFRDRLGNGGPLAAMEALLQRCVDELRSLDEPLRAALREVLTLRHPPTAARPQQLSQSEALGLSSLPDSSWLDILLPPPQATGFEAYLQILADYYDAFPAPVRQSPGQTDAKGLSVNDFFQEGGFLSQVAGDEYRVRLGQIDFTRAVAEALQTTTPYVLEAGTGVGKTLGYLVPLLLSGKRCYVSTYTKNLQDQAWTKDLPLVLQALELAGVERTVSIIKGKNNYVCPQIVEDWLDDLPEVLKSSEEVYAFAGVLHWLLLTETGWLGEVESLGQPSLLAKLGRDQAPPTLSETWVGRDPHSRAREAAKMADLVLVNHSFVFALAKHQTPEEIDIDVVLFDEAHNIEDVATEALTLDFTAWSLRSEIASLLKRDHKGDVRGLLRVVLEHRDVEKVAELRQFRDTLLPVERTLTEWCAECSRRLAEMCEGMGDYDPDLPVLFSMADFWSISLHQCAQTLHTEFQALSLAIESLLEKLPHLPRLPRRLASSLGSLHQHIEENAEAVGSLVAADAADRIRWGEARVRLDEQGLPRMVANAVEWWAVFHSTPLDVAAWLRETLYPRYPHRIYVSATLAVGGSFSSILSRLGLAAAGEGPEPFTHICPSPFNYREQALLAVPSDAPDPRTSTDPLYLETLSTNIAKLVEFAGGRTLVLFTSRRMMREVTPRLQALLKDQNVTVLAQTTTNRAALVERFRVAPDQGEKLVLLGLRAFWEGIDVPGEALVVLVVSRLPFDYAGHPVAIARREHYLSQGFDRDYFREVVVPATFLHLRQMYGRLIRKEDDRGVCVIMDPRIYIKRYGKYLLKRLPESARIVGKTSEILEWVERFLRGEPVPPDLLDWGELPRLAHGLSPEQRAIVESQAQRILVRAAAGSGKTTVLVERIVHLVESGQARPGEILALTFTRKAQDVMRERLSERLGDKGFELERDVLTYHQFAARILRQDAWERGEDVVFLNEDNPEKQSEILERARRRAGLTENELPDEDALTVIAYAQNGLVNENELESALTDLQRDDRYTAKLGRLFLTYVEQLRAEDLLDYGEAIVGAVRILRDNPRAKQMWSGRFKWIFCDEYQDTTPAQATLLSLIGQHAHLFAVGDSAQSIYSWHGADPNNLCRFEVDFPNTATFPLNKNYRCFPNLIRVSSRFLERCGQAHGIRITYDERRSTEAQTVYYLASDDDREEAEAIAALASDALKLEIPGDPPRAGTVGVLARKWWLLNALEIELIRQEVPYEFEGDTACGLSARPEVRQILVRAVDLLRRADTDQRTGDTPDGRAVADLRSGNITDAVQLLDRAQQTLGSDLSREARGDYRRLCAALKGKGSKVIVKLYGDAEVRPTIVLSTVHSQKGEEFDTVFVLGLEKGNSPHQPPRRHAQILDWRRLVQRLSHATWRAPLTDEDLQRLYEEEEQRIFYVAMTRARHNVIICHAQRRNRRPFAQSEFLERAKITGAVREVAAGYDITLTQPEARIVEPGYRTDGRRYETVAGVPVRSKSEMLLANEFTRRGMYFEYEEPSDSVVDALPDFVFPDYGGIILEHLGLLTDEEYAERWETKAKGYEQQGLRYFRTTEQEIQHLSATVDRLQEQFRDWTEQEYGSRRVQLIDLVERLRRDDTLQIGRAVGDFDRGVFEAESTSDEAVVAIAVVADDLGLERDRDQLQEADLLGDAEVEWEAQLVSGIEVLVARKA